MKRSTLLGVIIVVIILVGAGLVLTHGSSNSNNTSSHANTPASRKVSAPSQTTDNTTASTSVTIANMAFSPANITIKKNTTVTWTNNDNVTHTVTESDGQDGPNSGSVAPGNSYSFTYGTVGTFKYNCAIHPTMTGTVTVTE